MSTTTASTDASRDGHVPALPSRRIPAWAAVAVAMFAVAWGGNEFTPLLVMYRLDHGFSPVVVDLFLFAYVVGIVPALLIGGPLSDRIGRRPVMIPAPFVALVGSAILAVGADSEILLVAGRVLSGIGLGLGMAVGGSWLKELSAPPFGAPAADGAGARRAAMSLTAGFGIGAGVAGVLAQWAPMPATLSYLVNVIVCAVAGLAVLGAPETRSAPTDPGSLLDDLRIPSAGHRRFLVVVAPVAPWVFGAAGVAYAVLPTLMSERVQSAPVAFSALLCVVALGSGFATQSVGRRIDTPTGARALLTALGLLVVGMLIAATAARVLTIPVALVAAVVLGCGYGMALVAGLDEVQRIAGPDDLAGLTAVFYSLTYLGFAIPAILTVLGERFGFLTYPVMFAGGAVVAVVTAILVTVNYRAHLPVPHTERRVSAADRP